MLAEYTNRLPLAVEFYGEHYNKHRRMRLIVFSHFLNSNKDFAALSRSKQMQILGRVERGCLRSAIKKAHAMQLRNSWKNPKFMSLYESVCYRVSANLDPELVGTCQLVDRLVTGEVDQCEVGAMTSQELDPERDADLRKKIKDRQTTKVKLRVSTMYKCHKCGKSEVISELKYVRALDEGAAQEITCTFCGAMRRV